MKPFAQTKSRESETAACARRPCDGDVACGNVAKFLWRCSVLKRAMGWFTVVAVCAVFGGCKSGDDDAAPISQDELPGAMARLVCDSLGDCCSSAKLVFDSTNCRAATSARVKASLNETRTAAVKYDAEAAGDCVAELKKRAKCG